jgi:hypothetical protein
MTMVATTLSRPSFTDQETSTGDLVLRVCNLSRNGQIVRLKSAKCTIGSGPHCTLRLRAGGVSPLHCLILRGRTSTIVRRWAADTRLNHQSFTDAPLSCGDRLSVGPIELEVLSVGVDRASFDLSAESRPDTSHSVFTQATLERPSEDERKVFEEERCRLEELGASLDDRQASLSTLAEQIDGQKAELDRMRQQSQTELADAQQLVDAQREELNARQLELESQQKALEEEHRQLEFQCTEASSQAAAQMEQLAAQRTALEIQQNALNEARRNWEAQQNSVTSEVNTQAEQLQVRLTELEAAEKCFEQKRQEWEAAQAETQGQLNVWRDELDIRHSELEAQQKALAEERRLQEVQQSANAEQIASCEEQLSRRMAEIEAAQKGLEQRQQEWAAAQAEAENQLNARRDELNARQSELESQQEALAEERRQWEAERDALARQMATDEVESNQEPVSAEPEFQTPSEESPVDLADIFRRLGAKVDMKEEESEPKISVVAEQPIPDDSSQSSATASSRPVKETDTEETIDDYMHRLMQRVSGSRGPEYTEPPRRPSRVEQAAPTEAVQPETPKPSVVKSQGPATLSSPRAVAPETSIDISAFRELANLSAEIAIGHYSHKVLVKAMLSKLAVTIVASICGVALLWMWYSLSLTQITLYASLLALLIAFYWGLEYVLMTGRLIVSKSGHVDIEQKSMSSDKDAASPGEESVERADAGQEEG